MKSAFHFDESQIQFGLEVTSTLNAVRCANSFAKSKIFTGSLLFAAAASKTSHNRKSCVSRVHGKLYAELVDDWASSHPQGWCNLDESAKDVALRGTVFTVCFEALDATTIATVDRSLRHDFPDSYLGALEVDESLPSHAGAYRLVAMGRVDNGSARVFWDGITEDTKMDFLIDWFRNAGYYECEFESLNGKYSIFDADHGGMQSFRKAQSRQWMRQLLDSVSDNILGHLTDGAPAISDKVWNALREFQQIEVPEQASNVAFACRRIFESVTDELFPPTDDRPDRRDLGPDKFKNRLLMYLQVQKVSKTESALIEATMKTTAVELDSLCRMANKGLHAEFVRSQARRCLLRTLLLLDSLVSVRDRPLEVQIRENGDFIQTLRKSLDLKRSQRQ